MPLRTFNTQTQISNFEVYIYTLLKEGWVGYKRIQVLRPLHTLAQTSRPCFEFSHPCVAQTQSISETSQNFLGEYAILAPQTLTFSLWENLDPPCRTEMRSHKVFLSVRKWPIETSQTHADF